MKKHVKLFEDWKLNEYGLRQEMNMKVSLSLEPDISEDIFSSSLANGVGYLQGYGLELTWDDNEYKRAKDRVKGENGKAIIEDILMEILKDGGTLTFIDREGDGEYTSTITIKDVWEKVKTAPYRNIINIIDGNDDVDDADAILQTVFFGEVIFG